MGYQNFELQRFSQSRDANNKLDHTFFLSSNKNGSSFAIGSGKVGKQGENHITGTAPFRIICDAPARMGEFRAPRNSKSAATRAVARFVAWLPR